MPFSANESNESQFEIPTYTGLTWDLYLKPVMCLFGMATNLINISVFLSPNLKDTCYRYMLANSINNFMYLSFNLIATFFIYCNNCPSSQTYIAALYAISIVEYFTSCLAIYRISVEIVLSFQTYSILTKRNGLSKISYKLILTILFIASLFYYIQLTFAYTIIRIENPNGPDIYKVYERLFENKSY